MEIRVWLCYVMISCVGIQYLAAKTVSLNELIAAEKQKKENPAKTSLSRSGDLASKTVSLDKLIAAETQKRENGEKSSLPRSDVGTEPISLNEIITAESQGERVSTKLLPRKFTGLSKRFPLSKRLGTNSKLRKLKRDSIHLLGDKIISPLAYRKKFQIKSPLKPKKLKLLQKSKYKRRNQSIKREISGNENLKHTYIPLLKSLSMLFDNLLNSDESESSEIKTKKYKRNRYYFDEPFEISNDGSSEYSTEITKSRSPKKTTTPSPSVSTEISSDAESITPDEDNDHSSYRPNKSIPILLPRNTISPRRVYNGPSKGSGASFYRDLEGNITRDHRDHEYDTRCAKDESCAQGDKDDSNSVTRNDTSGIGYSGTDGDRTDTRNPKDRKTENSIPQVESAHDTNGKVQFEARGNKTESEESIREPVRKLRGFVSKDQITHNERLLSKSIQPKEVREESILSTTHNSTSHQRIIDKSGPFTTEDEKIRRRNETVILIERNSRSGNYSKDNGKKVPVVLIFDGYSVTRDKNGENKVSGKTIHIRS